MKKNPGRRERRNLFFSNRRKYGAQRGKLIQFYTKLAAKKKARGKLDEFNAALQAKFAIKKEARA